MEIVNIIGKEMVKGMSVMAQNNIQKQRDKLWRYLGVNKERVEKSVSLLNRKGIKLNYYDIGVVLASMDLNNKILSMNEGYYEECKKVLVKIAYIYCSITKESIIGIGFDEIAGVVRRRWSDLTFEEIVLAFELAAIGRFEGVGLKSYGAGFNLDMVGDVLEAYVKWKGSVKWGLLEVCDNMEKEEEMKILSNEEEILEKEYKNAFSWWMSIMARARVGGEIPDFKLLPFNLLYILNSRGFIQYEGFEEIKKEKYLEGIKLYIWDLRALKSEGRVMGLMEKMEINKKLEEYKDWREVGGDVSKDVIPKWLRQEGLNYGLKLFAVDYLDRIKRGEV